MTAEVRTGEMPKWLQLLLELHEDTVEGTSLECHGSSFVVQDGILRDTSLISTSQQQTSDTFGFKWQQRDTFESSVALERVRDWLLKRYGDPTQEGWLKGFPEPALVLDAGCGASMSALEYWGPHLSRRWKQFHLSSPANIPGGWLPLARRCPQPKPRRHLDYFRSRPSSLR